jgi:hypothetical protein
MNLQRQLSGGASRWRQMENIPTGIKVVGGAFFRSPVRIMDDNLVCKHDSPPPSERPVLHVPEND